MSFTEDHRFVFGKDTVQRVTQSDIDTLFAKIASGSAKNLLPAGDLQVTVDGKSSNFSVTQVVTIDGTDARERVIEVQVLPSKKIVRVLPASNIKGHIGKYPFSAQLSVLISAYAQILVAQGHTVYALDNGVRLPVKNIHDPFRTASLSYIVNPFINPSDISDSTVYRLSENLPKEASSKNIGQLAMFLERPSEEVLQDINYVISESHSLPTDAKSLRQWFSDRKTVPADTHGTTKLYSNTEVNMAFFVDVIAQVTALTNALHTVLGMSHGALSLENVFVDKRAKHNMDIRVSTKTYAKISDVEYVVYITNYNNVSFFDTGRLYSLALKDPFTLDNIKKIPDLFMHDTLRFFSELFVEVLSFAGNYLTWSTLSANYFLTFDTNGIEWARLFTLFAQIFGGIPKFTIGKQDRLISRGFLLQSEAIVDFSVLKKINPATKDGVDKIGFESAFIFKGPVLLTAHRIIQQVYGNASKIVNVGPREVLVGFTKKFPERVVVEANHRSTTLVVDFPKALSITEQEEQTKKHSALFSKLASITFDIEDDSGTLTEAASAPGDEEPKIAAPVDYHQDDDSYDQPPSSTTDSSVQDFINSLNLDGN